MSKFDDRPKNKPAAAKRKPKSVKADGTVKKRWSAAERATKGHGPRRSGGQRGQNQSGDSNYGQQKVRRSDQPQGEFTPYQRSRGDRMTDDRSSRWGAQGARTEPTSRGDRGRGFDRDDRRGDRGARRDDRGFDRDDRGGRGFSRDDRGFGRDDRGNRGFDREDRGGRGFSREDRGNRGFNRDDRGGRGFNRDDRGGRGFDREDRPRSTRWNDRDDRGGRDFDRDRRPARQFDREDRGGRGGDRDDRGRGQGLRRPDRSWDRPAGASREERYAKQNRTGQPSRGRQRFGEDTELAFDADIMEWDDSTELDTDAIEVSETDGFAQLGLPEKLVAALAAEQITTPFPIQEATIPVALEGRDVLGRGRTGSGKTLAFGLPMITRIAQRNGFKNAPAGIVLVPTRELALQVADALSPLARAMGLSLALVAGGMSYGPQIKKLSGGVDIVVATPGRLIDLMEQGVADLSHVQVAVLDEADHMADLGFMNAVTTLLDTTPEDGQRLLFSATLDGAVDKLVKRYMHDPALHEVDENRASVTTMEHHLLLVKPHHKNEITARVANRGGRTVIFARTQMGASRIANQLREAGVMAGALHGGLTQGARARVLSAFKSGEVPVLVATDVAARGIHVDDVSLVLQVDPPMNSKDYLHRAGRTARAGHEGKVVSIVLPHQRRATQRLVGAAGVKTEPVEVGPTDEQLVELTGAAEPSGKSISTDEYEAIIAPAKRAPRQGRGGKRSFGDRDFGKGRGGFGPRGGHGGHGKREFGGRNRSFNQPGRNKSGKPRNDQIATYGGWND